MTPGRAVITERLAGLGQTQTRSDRHRLPLPGHRPCTARQKNSVTAAKDALDTHVHHFEEREMEKIVVGIDGRRFAQQALAWPAAEARQRAAGLVVIHTSRQPTTALMSPYAPQLAGSRPGHGTVRSRLTRTGRCSRVAAQSVSQQVAHEASVPVVIIPPAAPVMDGHGSHWEG